MTSWNNIKARLHKNKTVFDFLFLITIIYLLKTIDIAYYFKIIIAIIIIVTLLINKKKQIVICFWIVFMTLLSIELVTNYFYVANHHFLLLYITIITIVYLFQLIDFKSFLNSLKTIIVIVIGIAAIQKLISPEFISGEYYYYMFNTGRIFRPFIMDQTEMSTLISQNWEFIESLKSTHPKESNSVVINNVFPGVRNTAIYFSWATIILEAIVAITLFVKPKSSLTHTLFIVLIVGVCLVRLETGFLSILAISGYILTDSLKFKLVYLTLITLFIGLILSGIGLS